MGRLSTCLDVAGFDLLSQLRCRLPHRLAENESWNRYLWPKFPRERVGALRITNWPRNFSKTEAFVLCYCLRSLRQRFYPARNFQSVTSMSMKINDEVGTRKWFFGLIVKRQKPSEIKRNGINDLQKVKFNAHHVRRNWARYRSNKYKYFFLSGASLDAIVYCLRADVKISCKILSKFVSGQDRFFSN